MSTKMIARSAILIALLSILIACNSQPEEQPQVTTDKKAHSEKASALIPTKQVLAEAINAHAVETPEMALPVFQQTVEKKPVLVLMANNPLLAPLPSSGKDRILKLAAGSRDELAKSVVPFQANPALLPNMTISAALAGEYFSRVLWIVPTTVEKGDFSGAYIKDQLLELGAIDDVEAATFQESNAGTTALIRNVPWLITRYTELPDTEDPVVLYLDMDFFQPLYKGEIKTPLLEIFYALLNDIKGKGWGCLNVILCRNNVNGLPLETRFLANDLTTAFNRPEILDSEPPLKWQQRKNALYLENFMQSEKIHAIYQELLKNDPDDPSIKFALYQSSRRLKRVDEALNYLTQAVELDRYYGLEYLNLAGIAAKKNLAQKQLDMFNRAKATFPDNPFLDLERVRLLSSMGYPEQARSLVDDLLKIQWSPIYFKNMKKYLSNLLAKSSNNKDMKL